MLASSEVDARSDIWSMGVMLYQYCRPPAFCRNQ
jgi:serine/threonine protein kinase